MKKDLFEILKNSVGCTYISDLKFGFTDHKYR